MISYECLNDNCFYVEALLSYEDVVWKPVWNSRLQDLDLTPHCPSCQEVMAIWDEAPNSEVTEDGTLQAKLPFSPPR